MKRYSPTKSIAAFVALAAGALLAGCHTDNSPQPAASAPAVTANPQSTFAARPLTPVATGAEPSTTTTAPTTPAAPAAAGEDTSDAISKIMAEGTNHSKVMETLSYLTDVIGGRLTGSPNLSHAYEWTQSKFTEWGLVSVHKEAWGPFGRGWELKHFSAQIVSPQTFPLIAAPQAWSPGLSKPIVADVVYLGAITSSNLNKYKGELAGAIVLDSPPREIPERWEPLATRVPETNLLRLANASGNVGFFGEGGRGGGGGGGGGRRGGAGGGNFQPPAPLSFLADEKVGVVVNVSAAPGDGGTIFVSQASLPTPARGGGAGRGGAAFTNNPVVGTNALAGGGVAATNDPVVGRVVFGTNAVAGGARGGRGGRGGVVALGGGPRVWSTNAPATPPQITLAAEDYNRLVRMIQQGEKLKMEVDLKVQFHDEDLMAYNTIAEIRGTDLADQIVMLGGHMDSWQSGTGATDNGAGVAACMEAVRIIKACDLHPRRTIRIALWSGEEQGLLGSRAYVNSHFGYFTNGPTGDSNESTTNRRHLVRGPEYDKLSAYFNLDNGAGKIRGVFMEYNEGVRPLFRRWLEPFRNMGAETLSPSATGSTDHVSFDSIGLPGFQFLQDPMDYFARTHHSNQDVFDRIQADDMKQASTILAAFVYNAAMLPDKLPRKPVVE